jgi:hypothetical protein
LASILAPACAFHFQLQETKADNSEIVVDYYWKFLPTTVTADTVAAAFTTPPTTIENQLKALSATGWTRFDVPNSSGWTMFRSAVGVVANTATSASITVATTAEYFLNNGMKIDVSADFGTIIEGSLIQP